MWRTSPGCGIGKGGSEEQQRPQPQHLRLPHPLNAGGSEGHDLKWPRPCPNVTRERLLPALRLISRFSGIFKFQ